MKKIANINLNEQSPENQKSVSNSAPRRLPPSGSGSGEGGGGTTLTDHKMGTGSGSNIISLSNNYSWNASCTFNWNTDITTHFDNGKIILDVFRIYFTNIQLVCTGINTGLQSSGIYYRPYFHSFLFSQISKSLYLSELTLSPTEPNGFCEIFEAVLTNQAFSVLETTYDIYGGEESSQVITCYSTIRIKITTRISDTTFHVEEPVSCDISFS